MQHALQWQIFFFLWKMIISEATVDNAYKMIICTQLSLQLHPHPEPHNKLWHKVASALCVEGSFSNTQRILRITADPCDLTKLGETLLLNKTIHKWAVKYSWLALLVTARLSDTNLSVWGEFAHLPVNQVISHTLKAYCQHSVLAGLFLWAVCRMPL